MEIIDRLENWGRYYRPYYVYQTCGSAEGMFRSNWRQWVPLSEIPNPEPMDVLDAKKIEIAWQSMSIQKQKEVLRYHFIYRAKPHIIARKARCRIWQLDGVLEKAIASISFRLNLLTHDKQSSMIHSNSDVTGSIRE